MLDKIKRLSVEISSAEVNSPEELEAFRLKYLSKKGLISDLFEDFRLVSPEQKKEVGQNLNELKQGALEKFNSLKATLQLRKDAPAENDLTRPAFHGPTGSRHPISIV